jgi:uncharacterized OsmC-like protein
MQKTLTIDVTGDVHDGVLRLPALPDVAHQPMVGLMYLLAHCTMLTFDGICRRQRMCVTQYVCTIVAQQRVVHPQIYETIALQMEVRGDVAHAQRITHGFHLIPKYCPVHATLAATCAITHHLTITEA